MKKEINTPRTNRAATDGWSGDAVCVPVEFAQKLERELIAAKKELKKAAKKCPDCKHLPRSKKANHEAWSCTCSCHRGSP